MSPKDKKDKTGSARELARRLGGEIQRRQLLQAGERVAVACSGGADSVALVRLLDELREPLGLRLIVVHLNHQLRGAEADEDEDFVCRLASERGLEAVAERVDVGAQARARQMNLEEAGRGARREFFEKLLQKGRADVVAVAHTLDDQAETVLARLLRGAGTRGLAGIHPVVELAGGKRLVRPLLSIRRAELRGYLHTFGQAWREDASNQSRDRLRNRLRLDALPLLTQLGGPHVLGHLARLAEQAREEESFWEAFIEVRVRASAVPVGDGFELPVAALGRPALGLKFPGDRQARQAERALARRLVRRVLGAVRGDLRRITQSHVESVLRLAEEGKSNKRVVLPGVQVERRFDRLVFAGPAAATGGRPEDAPYRVEIAGPGLVRLPSGGALAFKLVGVEEVEKSYNRLQGAADASRAAFPLVVRPWRAGDRYRPAGAAQVKKLKALFQQGRVPAAQRRRTPVVLCREEIIWVPRFGVAASYGLLPDSRTALVIEERAEA